ncbi:hypothetical protein IC220_01750 [Wolbachia endosymbiont of Pentalonia nigronervosa]|uniref:hypothetical protein n=1 Tax=Wolbachia endosymbiont of Pentalonia nigronervosa TaxID=1301914 RepID=UPI00165EEEB1|nr:hypothetical protein [Wolbachia endosymbiont of Pentalonia nigronervosa]MBD0391184.1 hypothetical protein [Wolbachia endosymbiont of Pentalonia nigronervosa]
MLARDAERYALAFIKKFGSSNKIQYFLPLVFNSTQARQEGWNEKHFDGLYEQFIAQQARQNNTQNFQTNADFRANIGQPQNNTHHFQPNTNPQANTGQPQTIRIEHVQVNTHSDFWDCLLLQCWLNSLFGRHNHPTVTTNYNYGNVGNNSTNHTDKKKEADDGRKLLAAGIVVVIVVAIFHISMCYWYARSRETARKSGEIDYLDNTLKTLRNIEFLGAFASVAGLIACVVYPVLPTWGLVALGIHSFVCFMGGLAFHMQHERESEDIDAAKKAVKSYLNPAPAPSAPDPNDFPDYGPPPPYFDPGFNSSVFPPNSQFNDVGAPVGQQPSKVL